MAESYSKKLEKLVLHISQTGTYDTQVLKAISSIPRDVFIPKEYRDQAYKDIPLPIGYGQTISQPSLVALMTQLLQLQGSETVLEIGTGSGYQAAILSRLSSIVHTVERIPELASFANRNLNKLHIKNVHVHVSDGTLGLPKYAPYNAIVVTAGAKEQIPRTLINQLANRGRLVIPVGTRLDQRLIAGVKEKNTLVTRDIEPVRFVPLVGKRGWSRED